MPHRKFIVITGLSGSGKSSLAFHLLYAEAQRRYMSTLESSFVRTFVETLERPDVDRVSGLQSVIGISQETSGRRTHRSTVGTITDIYSFLRLLYARVGRAYSYLNGKRMVQQSEEEIEKRILEKFCGQKVTFVAPVVSARRGHYASLFAKFYKKGFKRVIVDGKLVTIRQRMALGRYNRHDIDLIVEEDLLIDLKQADKLRSAVEKSLFYGKGTFSILQKGESPIFFSTSLMDIETGLAYKEATPNSFSFNSPHGACLRCLGLGNVNKVNFPIFCPDPTLSISQGAFILLGSYKYIEIFKRIESYLRLYRCNLGTPVQNIPEPVLDGLFYGSRSNEVNSSVNLVQYLLKKTRQKHTKPSDPIQIQPCPLCEGKRLNQEALHFKINNKNIAELSAMSLKEMNLWLTDLPNDLTNREHKISENILGEIKKRVQLLLEIGLHYLSLDRPFSSLSSGEIRRIRIGGQIGTQNTHLVGIMYILDEPSIGLHPRDNKKLILALKKLRDLGNTVIVIEHDEETMLAADYLVEIGPGAGEFGGEIVAKGTPKQFLTQPSLTAQFLQGSHKIPIPTKRRKGNKKQIVIQGCTGYTLKEVTLTIPLGKLTAITGVSGSGKSTLIHQTLYPIIKKHLQQQCHNPLPYKSAQGLDHIDKVIEVTQNPIGRTTRSNLATYIQAFNKIRTLFAQLPQAQIRGYKPQHFSFNIKGGRCEECGGIGLKKIDMDFLPTVQIKCDACQGNRYKQEILAVKYRGKSIANILEMTVTQVHEFFKDHPFIAKKLHTLKEVGLHYLRLGQHTTTLSGGEAQRLKLASELSKRDTTQTLYILDEPTTGLHFQDTAKLLDSLQKLIEKGNTIICIEHNLDVIKVADHIIDIGPEAGEEGGHIIAEGTPEEVALSPKSHTGVFLKKILANP